MSKVWKETLQMTALGVGVSIIGLAIGAFLMSPSVSPDQRLAAFATLAAATAAALLAEPLRHMGSALRKRRGRRTALAHAHHGAPRPATAAPPTISLRGGRVGKTPRTVRALAAAGAAPAEIARKTGLPLDAVSMLLEIHGGPLAAR
ncbi:MAG: hypothetical protein ACK6DR_10930 [Gemmatimonas sp.]|jgi:hypothetical protein|uniref:hypothetical protein n=1 Tax=Gemmatimonas sp. TaxID=1962908 RepID=UPI0022C3A942|nr:hypothetical protein [Gemmatimonas sp.]MCA2984525.1 hypothetical protein [Gemmatimonas sp.]MCA2985896.1 hypothetical protein [Gemmatimonas sp.]MCA2993577.1 hypothetical protein [Gemmatimonas sp.]MCE2954350.1 hypothetical protein [Gemmatimonas sp.]MCZ8011510.1 hypothetical protein [Gemmatimonas sp.]